MSNASKHVFPGLSGGWAVKSMGATRAAKTFLTQSEAVKYGREIARKHHSDLFVHGRDGTIKGRNSYGPAPITPRDAKR